MMRKDSLDPADVLRTLIRYDTTNPPGNERAALLWLQELLASYGIDCVIQGAENGRGNLVARLPATSEKLENLILLSHIDVVGADASQWLEPPFAANLNDGFIYGRGAVDTKQLTAMQLSAFLALAQSALPRNRDVWFIVTCDEECGSEQGLLALLKETLLIGGVSVNVKDIFAGAKVISEGGGFPVTVNGETVYLCETGQKGVAHCTMTAVTENTNPFLPDAGGFSGAMAAVREIAALESTFTVLPTVSRFLEELSSTDKTDSSLGHTSPVERSARGIEALTPHVAPFMKDILFAMTHNTVAVTMITGAGLSETRVTLDCRVLPGTAPDMLRAFLEPVAARNGMAFSIDKFSPGYESEVSDGFYDLLCDCTCRGLNQKVRTLPFLSIGSSDGRHIAPLGASVYGYSPVYAWDMTFDTAVSMVHGVNERIHPDSVRLGANILTGIVKDYANDTKGGSNHG